jgi:bifunctional DNA-binding transcriptional regulator/antitoxin component of YhaV-PrlF toxin-antitoxin module
MAYMSDHYMENYWSGVESKKYIVPVDGDGILTFPDELMDALDWKAGDTLEWIDNKDGSFTLKKI